MDPRPRVLNAGNAGPFTLDGTRTHIVGRRLAAVVDPGPDAGAHLRAVASALAEAERVVVLLTHGHADHAGGAPALADLLGERGIPCETAGPGTLQDGASVETDAGALVAVSTPGHTRDHLAFHWPAGRALIAGDLVLGRGDTTWVGEYPGCVGDYLASLERVRELDLEVILPAHGPPLTDPRNALDRFAGHRHARIEEVRRALAVHPRAGPEELLDRVYGGSVPPELREAARGSLEAILHHLRDSPK